MITATRRLELVGVMWDECSPINTDTLTEYQVDGSLLAADFQQREIKMVTPEDGGLGYVIYKFREEQEEYLKPRLIFTAPLTLTVWQFVTGTEDNQRCVREVAFAP